MADIQSELVLARLSVALAPLALAKQSGLGQTLDRVFKGTPVESVLANIQRRGGNRVKRDGQPV